MFTLTVELTVPLFVVILGSETTEPFTEVTFGLELTVLFVAETLLFERRELFESDTVSFSWRVALLSTLFAVLLSVELSKVVFDEEVRALLLSDAD